MSTVTCPLQTPLALDPSSWAYAHCVVLSVGSKTTAASASRNLTSILTSTHGLPEASRLLHSPIEIVNHHSKCLPWGSEKGLHTSEEPSLLLVLSCIEPRHLNPFYYFYTWVLPFVAQTLLPLQSSWLL